MNDQHVIAATLRQCLTDGMLADLSQSVRGILRKGPEGQGRLFQREDSWLRHKQALPLVRASVTRCAQASRLSNLEAATLLFALGFAFLSLLLIRRYGPFSSPVVDSTSTVAKAGGITSAPGGGR